MTSSAAPRAMLRNPDRIRWLHANRLPRRIGLIVLLLCTAFLAGLPERVLADDVAVPAPAPGPIEPPSTSPSKLKWLTRWFNPATAPFIPVPEIAVDPDSGTTLGLIPTWIQTDDQHEIRRIIAPDVLYNPYFGFGVHGRIYGYTSGDEQWSAVAGIKERVERELNLEYQKGRLREQRWSFTTLLVYDRDGTPRFYGLANNTVVGAETNYTNQQERGQAMIGLNLTRAWQLLYTARLQVVDVLPGTLSKVASIETRFGGLQGLGTNKELLNRLSLVYDTRDDQTVPSKGVQLVAYGGLASRNGLFNDSLFSEAGVDGRGFWPVAKNTVLVTHMALRYLLTTHEVPFWALSSLGGGQSEVGGAQPLRGFGAGRYYDRDSFSSSVELRRKVFSFDATSTFVDIEMTPFIDVGRVFAQSDTFPLKHLHHVYGLGFRGIARPFVVGYVDIGYGSEGVAAFTGLNYPF
jgi:Omp85 superfamily domain